MVERGLKIKFYAVISHFGLLIRLQFNPPEIVMGLRAFVVIEADR